MATSAGVLGLSTATEAQAALERGDAPPEADEAGVVRPCRTRNRAASPERWADAGQRSTRWRGRRMAMTVGVVMVAAMLAVVASLQTLPTAEITLAPRTAAWDRSN